MVQNGSSGQGRRLSAHRATDQLQLTTTSWQLTNMDSAVGVAILERTLEQLGVDLQRLGGLLGGAGCGLALGRIRQVVGSSSSSSLCRGPA